MARSFEEMHGRTADREILRVVVSANLNFLDAALQSIVAREGSVRK
jgi:hypothetical protein